MSTYSKAQSNDELKEKIWYLKDFNIMTSLDDNEKEIVSSLAAMKSYDKKCYIHWQEWSYNHVYFLKHGHVKITKINEEG